MNIMEKVVEVAIEKIDQLKLEKKNLFEYELKFLPILKTSLETESKNFNDLKENFINSWLSSNKKDNKKNGYFEIILDCYEKYLISENQLFKDIFEKYNNLIINSFHTSIHQHQLIRTQMNSIIESQTRISNLRKGIEKLEKEIENNKKSTEDNQWIEDLKNLHETNLEAMKKSEDWHPISFKEKLNLGLKSLETNRETKSLFE